MRPCHWPDPHRSATKQGRLGNTVFPPGGLKPFVMAPKNQSLLLRKKGNHIWANHFCHTCLYDILQVLTPWHTSINKCREICCPFAEGHPLSAFGLFASVLLALHFFYSWTYFLTIIYFLFFFNILVSLNLYGGITILLEKRKDLY